MTMSSASTPRGAGWNLPHVLLLRFGTGVLLSSDLHVFRNAVALFDLDLFGLACQLFHGIGFVRVRRVESVDRQHAVLARADALETVLAVRFDERLMALVAAVEVHLFQTLDQNHHGHGIHERRAVFVTYGSGKVGAFAA